MCVWVSLGMLNVSFLKKLNNVIKKTLLHFPKDSKLVFYLVIGWPCPPRGTINCRTAVPLCLPWVLLPELQTWKLRTLVFFCIPSYLAEPPAPRGWSTWKWTPSCSEIQFHGASVCRWIRRLGFFVWTCWCTDLIKHTTIDASGQLNPLFLSLEPKGGHISADSS